LRGLAPLLHWRGPGARAPIGSIPPPTIEGQVNLVPSSVTVIRWFTAWLTTAGTLAAQSIPPAEFLDRRRAAETALAARQFEVARSGFEALVKSNPRDGRLSLRLGDALVGLGRGAAAVAAYRQALALGAGTRATRSYTIARLYAGLGESDSALVWIERALAARYESRPSIADDSAFRALRDDPRFRRLAQIPPAFGSRDDGWRYDVAVFAEEAKRLATGPYPVAWTPRFDSAVARLSARVGALSDERIYVELQRIATMLGNGHSILYPFPAPHLALTQLPIDLYRFTDGLYVIGGTGSAASLVGSRVERLGGVDADAAIERVAPFVTRDNPIGVLWNGPYFLEYPALVRAIGGDSTGDPNQVRLMLRDAAGQPREVTVTGGDLRPPAKLVVPPGRGGPIPLYLSRPDDNYWLRALPAESAVYVQFNQVQDQGKVTIAAFADTMLAALRRRQARNLIIDVRRNNGGSSTLNRPLVRAMVQFEGWGPDRQIYVIVGRNTFSAAGNFLNAVERITNARFAGEPSSAKPNSVGEDTEILLPYSGIRGSLASRYFQDSDPNDDRLWIPIDIPVELTSRDYFANRDPVLAAVLETARRGPVSGARGSSLPRRGTPPAGRSETRDSR
jgi:tetratricopeptide (TPR) repeat protein